MAKKTIRVYVTAPEGRFIPGLGGRERGEFYEVNDGLAQQLVAADAGLTLEKEPVKTGKVED